MHEATCIHCGRSVPITPDAPRCSHCGQDLHEWIPPDFAASYFYRRSADLASRGDLPSALSEVERGLAFQEASELRLLAAILSKRLGDVDTMRAHIAAIPVDDRLRQEAEWLIRAQSAPRTGARIERTRPAGEVRLPAAAARQKAASPPLAPPPAASSPVGSSPAAVRAMATTAVSVETAEPRTTISQTIAESSAEPPPPLPARREGQWVQRVWSVVAVLLMLVVGAMGWLLLSGGPDALLTLIPGFATLEPESVADAPLAPVTPAPTVGVILPTPTPKGGNPAGVPTIPSNLVLVPTPAALASGDEMLGLQAAAFNLDSVLITIGRSDLAALDLNAELAGTTVKLTGVVTNSADRESLIEMLGSVGSVQEVNAVDLLVRVPATYTVQAGDSVWSIVNRFYGEDLDRVTDLMALNAAQLPTAELLQVGMVLVLPAVE